jgi:hypothetical protein
VRKGEKVAVVRSGGSPRIAKADGDAVGHDRVSQPLDVAPA